MTEEKKERKKPRPMRTYPKPLPKDYKMSQVQKVIRKYRVIRRFTRNRLGQEAGVWPLTIKEYETDNMHNPRLLQLAAVLSTLELDLWVIDRKTGTLIERLY